jgi:beta-glucosidase/6-phospho-beta-glucosidase/beta-galactosidase
VQPHSFGDRVHKWTTFNEPWVTCNLQVCGGLAARQSLPAWHAECLSQSLLQPIQPTPHAAATVPPLLPQYGNGDFAPGIKYGETGKWKCGHNLLLAHAKAVKLFKDKYKAATGGKIGMALWSEWSEPWTGSAGGACLCVQWGQGRSRAGADKTPSPCAGAHAACSPPFPAPLNAPVPPVADKRAAQNKLDTDFGWFADAIHFGDYPAHIKKTQVRSGWW